jgi:hypothetical protein
MSPFCLLKRYTIKTYGRVKVLLKAFLLYMVTVANLKNQQLCPFGIGLRYLLDRRLRGFQARPGRCGQVKVTLLLTVGRSVCLGVEPTLGHVIRYYFLSEGICLKIAILSLCEALSNESTVPKFAVQLRDLPFVCLCVFSCIWKKKCAMSVIYALKLIHTHTHTRHMHTLK